MYGNGLVEIGVFWEVWGVLGWFGVFRGRRFAKKEISRIICTVMVWWSLGCFRVVWGGLGVFQWTARRLCYQIKFANEFAADRFMDSSASRCRLTHDIWYPALCSAAHKKIA